MSANSIEQAANGRRPRTVGRRAGAALIACAALAALAPGAFAAGEGGLDQTFGNHGVAISPVNLPNPGAEVYTSGPHLTFAALTSDNGPGFHYFHLVLFAADGRSTIASTFSMPTPNTSQVLRPVGIVREPDGKYIAVGAQHDAALAHGAEIVLARFNPDGSADTGFGINGIKMITPTAGVAGFGQGCNGPNGPIALGDAVATAATNAPHPPDILVAGTAGCALTLGASSPNRFPTPTVYELSEDGAIVSQAQMAVPERVSTVTEFQPTAITRGISGQTFIVGNIAGTLGGRTVSEAFAAKWQAGDFAAYGGNGNARLIHFTEPSGTQASSSAATGTVVDPVSNGLLVTGWGLFGTQGSGGHEDLAVAKLDGAGNPDVTNFGAAAGQTLIPSGGFALGIAARSDGKIYVSGDRPTSPGFNIFRLGPTGQPDATFGLDNNGLVPIGLTDGLFVDPGAVIIQSNGFPVVTASGSGGTGGSFVLARLSAERCTLCSPTLIQQSPTGVTIAAAHGLGGASMGILVQRRVHGKIHTLGRVPFGPQRTGRVKIHWDLAVEGKPLKQGSYLITLRALDDNGDVVAINKPVRLKIRHH